MKPFQPHILPLSNIDWADLVEQIAQANRELGNLRGTLKGIINPSVLLSPLTLREAVLSSRIEGTQATLQEVLFFEAIPDAENPKRHDIQEIINYRKTLAAAEKMIQEKPVHLNMIKDLHSILMDSVRGDGQRPGEFRSIQNWIGPKGCTIDQAYFVPPDIETMQSSLSSWERYWHSDERDLLVQLAILHGQFEVIHPFRDGNGRMGRVLIPLFLTERNAMDKPVFYLSEYLESHRSEYYSRLRAISEENDWDGWIRFFLQACTIQSIAIRNKAEKIIDLYENMKREIYSLNSTHGLPALDTLFTMPLFSSSDFEHYSGIPKASANRLLNLLQEKEIIKINIEGQGRRPNTYLFPELIEITESPLEVTQ